MLQIENIESAGIAKLRDMASGQTERKRAGPIDECVPATAAFFDCRVWGEKDGAGRLRHVIFGLRADAAAARYLYDLGDQASWPRRDD